MASEETFASGRYSKRKRTKLTYHDSEPDLSGADTDNEDALPKKRMQAKDRLTDEDDGTDPEPNAEETFDNLAPLGMAYDDSEATDEDGLESESDYEMTHSKTRRSAKKVKAMKGKRAPKPRKHVKSKVFPFLSLPAELRIQIYEYALVDSYGIHLKAKDTKGDRSLTADKHRHSAQLRHLLSPALLGVNKQIHHEASEFLYKNEFVFQDGFAFDCFAGKIGLHNIQQLRNVRILWLWDYNTRARAILMACFTTLKLATGLIAFHMHHADFYGSYIQYTRESDADRFFQLASSWLFAVGAAQGKLDAGIDLLKFGYDSHQMFLDDKFFKPGVKERAQRGYTLFKDRLRELLKAERKRVRAKAYPPKKTKKAKNERQGV